MSGLGFRVWGLGLRVYGLGFEVAAEFRALHGFILLSAEGLVFTSL